MGRSTFFIGQTVGYEKNTCLFAFGREAAIENLKLENAGESLARNKIQGDQDSKTIIPSIYAIGDCILDKSELASTAVKAGRIIARNLFANQNERMDYSDIGRTHRANIPSSACLKKKHSHSLEATKSKSSLS